MNRGVPFIATSADGWDCFMAETCSQPIFLDDEIRIYYTGSDLHHDWWMFGEPEGLDVPEARPGWNGGQTGLGVATLRPEGFVWELYRKVNKYDLKLSLHRPTSRPSSVTSYVGKRPP